MLGKIRNDFRDFFKQRNHLLLPSASLIPHNDKSLLLVNSGMVPFKDIFLGKETLPNNNKNAASIQKCIRAGGKHNDLDNVGYTTRHHTMFEMMGNFSFGGYYKEEAILYCWQFLTEILSLSKEKLYITVYHDDDESFNLWKKITNFSDDKIIKIKTDDNFWSMGPTGPCGPCTEIYYDYGPTVSGTLPSDKGHEGERFVEIWNLVFTQYNQLANNKREELQVKCVDTGMGLERILSVLENKTDNYQTSLFQEIGNYIKDNSNINKSNFDINIRVISDHLRSIAFMISDGILPSNEGVGYVLRRIIRRAIRYLHQMDNTGTMLSKFLPVIISTMSNEYTELTKKATIITEAINTEEELFRATLSKGINILENAIKNKIESVKNGSIPFELYDTYGFPFDLTQDILRQKNIITDTENFNALMQQQRNKAKKDRLEKQNTSNDIWLEILQNIKEKTLFTGYESLQEKSTITHITNLEGKTMASVKENEEAWIFTKKTPFYAEGGGQLGDEGSLIHNNITIGRINDVQKQNDVIGHKIIALSNISLNDELTLSIDENKRKQTTIHHSSVHLLHAGLHEITGQTILQKGSQIYYDKARFDFSLERNLSTEEIVELENLINNTINKDFPTIIEYMTKSEADQKGILSQFDEKYKDIVRVLTIGGMGDKCIKSIELCGGTHVKSTGEIGFCKIIKQSSIGSGVRRIELISGNSAIQYLRKTDLILNDIAKLVNSSTKQLLENDTKSNEDIISSNHIITNISNIVKDLDNKNNLITALATNVIKDAIKNQTGIMKRIKTELPQEKKFLPKILKSIKDSYNDNILLILSHSKIQNNSFLVVATGNNIIKNNKDYYIDILNKINKLQNFGKNFESTKAPFWTINIKEENLNNIVDLFNSIK